MWRKILIAVMVLMIGYGVYFWYVKTFGISISPEKFMEMSEEVGVPISVKSVSYEPVEDGKARLSVWKYGQIPETIIYWTDLDQLPDDFCVEMQATIEKNKDGNQWDDSISNDFQCYRSIQQVIRNWKTDNPVAARDAVNNADITDQQRESLLRGIEVVG